MVKSSRVQINPLTIYFRQDRDIGIYNLLVQTEKSFAVREIADDIEKGNRLSIALFSRSAEVMPELNAPLAMCADRNPYRLNDKIRIT